MQRHRRLRISDIPYVMMHMNTVCNAPSGVETCPTRYGKVCYACPLNRNHKQPNLWEATVWLLSQGNTTMASQHPM